MFENVLRKPVDSEPTPSLATGRHRLFLFAILLIAGLLGVPFLETLPNGFHADEASIGYDAFSILKTSRDQYGGFLPLFSRSFGDYDEALYRFLTVPFISIFGLNEFATLIGRRACGHPDGLGLIRPRDRTFQPACGPGRRPPFSDQPLAHPVQPVGCTGHSAAASLLSGVASLSQG